jgi:glucose-6-phosphate dehydrogenase assembly protein OpcA
MEAPMNAGEPIAAGQGVRPDEGHSLRFADNVDLPRIQKLLHEAREIACPTGETIATLNLVASFFSEAAYARARPALEAATRIHPCRLIVLVAEPKVGPDSVLAQVAVTPGPGSAAIEKVVLVAKGRAVRHLESAMMGLLLPEMPLVVLWSARAEGPLFQHALGTADRVIVDSGTRPPQALAEVARLLAKGAPIGDLAWARIFPWQSIAADVFDLPNLREHRGNLRRARIVCAGGVGAEGALLGGWFASRVKRAEVELVAGASAEVDSPVPGAGDGTSVAAFPAAAPIARGQVIGFEIAAPPCQVQIRRERGILEAQVSGDDDGDVVHRMRIPPETPGRLLGIELKLLSGHDELYAQAALAAAKLLASRS